MKLFTLREGVVDGAYGDIVNIKNEITSGISDAIASMGFREPDVEFAATSDDNASIFIDMGRGHVAQIEVHADDDIAIHVPIQLSELLKIHDYYKLSSLDDTILALQKIKTRMQEPLV